MNTKRFFLVAAAALIATLAPAARADDDAAPAGPYVPPAADELARATSFRSSDRIVMTYYFYWYDARSGAHMRDGDGTDALTTHPASLDDFSYKSVAWHRKQFEDMEKAGIDVALPVFWGTPADRGPKAPMYWSFAGLGPMVEAREALVKEGKNPPRLGLFYDTSTLAANAAHRHVDLTTDSGKAWFYHTIRDFFSMVPARHWALIDGRPIVSLYAAAFARKHDASLTADLNRRFAADFAGRTPFLIREVSWAIPADAVYAWGGAVSPRLLDVAEIGPGYDHSAVPGRTPLVTPREDGAFYENAWKRTLRRAPNLVAIETWNEFHEGTDIAESREYGRKYIDLTRAYVDLYKKGVVPPAVPGPYSGAKALEITLGATNIEKGLRLVEVDDGRTSPADEGGRRPVKGANGGRYLYFAADDSFKDKGLEDLAVEVEFRDVAPGRLSLQYDGRDPSAPFSGAYTPSPDVTRLNGSGLWRTATFRLNNRPRLVGCQNGAADFRLAVEAPDVVVRRVALIRRPSS
jgi:hypothetical protein